MVHSPKPQTTIYKNVKLCILDNIFFYDNNELGRMPGGDGEGFFGYSNVF